jgi:Rne/Rng family ribonuclease
MTTTVARIVAVAAVAVGGGKGNAPKASDEARAKRLNLRRRYKIQDVIHRRQVLLVQVVKEERGNKGAALTTYLSLAGRYCVLMPNTSHGGGISRKISSASDRKRLKSIISDLSCPPPWAASSALRALRAPSPKSNGTLIISRVCGTKSANAH